MAEQVSDCRYSALRLENQLCFPLYAASREVVKRYRPYLDPLGITYTQYIAMMVFWEQKKCSVKELGEKLYLDSGTLTPVLSEIKGTVEALADESPEILQMHGFYGDEQAKTVMFDLIIDFSADAAAVRDAVAAKLKAQYPDYRFDIVLDSDYSD